MKVASCLILIFHFLAVLTAAQSAWQADLDSHVRFYQTTDFGLVLAGTERSLYAIDGQTGGRVWRRETGRVNETSVAMVPNTDLILFSRDLGDKSRLEAIDVLSGSRIWQSDKVKGDVMQLAVDPQRDLLAIVLVRDPRGTSGKEFKGKPIVHMLRLSSGDELWKRESDSDVEMMPTRFGVNLGDVAFTLDNYRAPLLLDGRLFLFYDGVTSCDAQTGKEKEREKFSVNENGLALTEADPVFDESRIYISGRGRIRAVDRRTGSVVWKADDLGTASEIVLAGDVLYIRTGGQFTRLKDGEAESKGPFGMSAIDTSSGKTIWRYKGADRGLTNFVFVDPETIVIADRDNVILLDAKKGDRKGHFEHKVERPQYVLLNERGDAVVGGRDTIASFKVSGAENWRVRHKAPGRGVLAIVGGVALRAGALYFRYGGFAISAFGLASGGLNLINTANSFRWSGLSSRFGSFDLTTLASNATRSYVTNRIYSYGSLARLPSSTHSLSGFEIERPNFNGRLIPSKADVQDNVFDRLDPARQAEKLSDYLLRRKRVSELRGKYMYFFTDLAKPFERKGLVGVNIHTGQDVRFILNSDPDAQFVTDDSLNLLYSSDGDHLQAFTILSR